jgi:hypothetical protein
MTQDWEAQARKLRIGQSRKIQHCSTDQSASITNRHNGVSLYCHRCGEKPFVPHGPRSLAEIMATRAADDALQNQRVPTMPATAVAVASGPVEAWQWVLAGGISPEDATALYGMRWHEATRRVLIPILDRAGNTIALLGRAVFKERPKYRIFSGAANTYYRAPMNNTRCTVVVEDVLSAIAVRRAGANAIAVLGTSITPEHAAEVADDQDIVCGWFDDDPAGNRAWAKLRKRLRLYPVTVHRITTKADPKALHRQELRDILTPYLGA